MRVRSLIAGLVLVGCGPVRGSVRDPPPARGELRVWTTRAIATVLAQVGPEFERTSGVRLSLVSDLPPRFASRRAAGEPFDLLISGSATVDEWIREGHVVAATRTDLARSGIGVAVRAGAPKPDLGSVPAFRRALLAAESVAYLRVGSGL